MKNSLKHLLYTIKNVFLLKNNSLQKKYMSWFLAIILIPIFLIVAIVFTYSVSSRRNQIESDLIKTLNATENIISVSLDSINTQASSILIKPRVTKAICTNDPIKDTSNIIYTQDLLSNIRLANESVSSASIYSFESDYIFGTNGGDYLHDIKKGKFASWYDHYKKTGETDYIISVKETNYNYVCMVKSIYKDSNLVGFAVFYIDFDKLISLHNQEKYIFVSSDNTILHSYVRDQVQKNICNTDNSLSDFYFSDNSTKITFSKSLAKTQLPYYKITLIAIMKDVNYSFLLIYIIILLVAIVLIAPTAFFFSVYLTDIFYSHIAKTLSYLTTDTNDYNGTQDELAWVKNRIYSIIASNKELEFELAQNIVNLKNLHIAAMQFQYNPHFLFNSLNLASMNAISELGLNNITTKIISLVSDLLRTSLDVSEYFIEIADELSYAKKYIQIEKLKYNDAFDVEFDIDESVLHFKTVKLTMQPLIENAFQHGIHKLPKSERGLLSISIKSRGDVIVFKICDNGNADAKTLEIVNDKLKNNSYTIEKENIGLKNVNSRIKGLLGEEYGCNIYRKNNMTVSEIVIPQKI